MMFRRIMEYFRKSKKPSRKYADVKRLYGHIREITPKGILIPPPPFPPNKNSLGEECHEMNESQFRTLIEFFTDKLENGKLIIFREKLEA